MQHGDKCDIWALAGEGGQWFAKFRRKAHAFSYRRRLISVARWLVRSRLDGRLVVIMMAYRKILSQTDRATLWALVRTAVSGIMDPYELYKHMHPSAEIGTCTSIGLGSGMPVGGASVTSMPLALALAVDQLEMFKTRKRCLSVLTASGSASESRAESASGQKKIFFLNLTLLYFITVP